MIQSRFSRPLLQGILLLATLALLQGIGCPNDSDPDSDSGLAPCAIVPSGPAQLEVGQHGTYTYGLGSGWTVNTSEEWTASPSGHETQHANDDLSAYEVSFDEAGTYTITVTLDDDNNTPCEEGSSSIEVEVVEPAPDCEVTIAGSSTLYVGVRGDYSFSLGSGWNPDAPGTWSVSPSGNETVHVDTPTAYALSFSTPGTYTIAVNVTDDGGGGQCEGGSDEHQVVVSQPSTVPTGSFSIGLNGLDGIRIAYRPGWSEALGSETTAFVASDHGLAAVDMFSRSILPSASLLSDEPADTPPLGGMFMRVNYRDDQLHLLRFGMDGGWLTGWDHEASTWFEFGQLIEWQAAITDAVHFLDGEEGGLYISSWGQVNQLAWNEGWGSYEQSGRIQGGDLPGAGSPASAVGSEADGSMLVATGGTPGELWLWHDSGSGFEATDLGDAGHTPRRLRALNGIAVLSNFGSGTITILTWDGAGSAAITATQAVGDGPVGVDLLERAGGGVYAITTGWNDNSYTITEIDGAGAVVNSTTTVLPAGHLQPAHGAWLHDIDESFVVSCFGSGHLFVERRVP